MAEFDWWLLIVGVVAGGGLVALVLSDSVRRDEEISDRESRAEAAWAAEWLDERGASVATETVVAVLRAHRAYLRLAPPDELVPDERTPGGPVSAATSREA